MSEIKVKIADFKVGRTSDTLTTFGLGSCVAVTLYDPEKRVGGLAHIMLPDQSYSKETTNRAKFPQTAISDMCDEMVYLGGERKNFVAKVVGGANMFSTSGKEESSQTMGSKNVEAAKSVLNATKIKIVAEDTGANYGRSVRLLLETGEVIVRSYRTGEKRI